MISRYWEAGKHRSIRRVGHPRGRPFGHPISSQTSAIVKCQRRIPQLSPHKSPNPFHHAVLEELSGAAAGSRHDGHVEELAKHRPGNKVSEGTRCSTREPMSSSGTAPFHPVTNIIVADVGGLSERSWAMLVPTVSPSKLVYHMRPGFR